MSNINRIKPLNAGFTLIEVLIVLSIVAVAAGAVSVAVGSGNEKFNAEKGLSDLSQAFANISEEAAITNNEMAVKFVDGDIIKYELLETQKEDAKAEYEWIESGTMNLEYFHDNDFTLLFESSDIGFDASAALISPDVVFYRTGEYEPAFELNIINADEAVLAQSKGDGFNPLFSTTYDDE